VVAERVAQAEVDPVRALGGLLGGRDTLGLESGVHAERVVGGEEQVPTGDPQRDVFADPLGHGVAHRRRAALFQQDLPPGFSDNTDGEPAHESQVLVGGYLQPELADVEFDGLPGRARKSR